MANLSVPRDGSLLEEFIVFLHLPEVVQEDPRRSPSSSDWYDLENFLEKESNSSVLWAVMTVIHPTRKRRRNLNKEL